jgi:hypothetical protein
MQTINQQYAIELQANRLQVTSAYQDI